MPGVNEHRVPYVICVKERYAIKTMIYKHAQVNIHVYKSGSNVHALRHGSSNQNNVLAQRR